MRDVISAMSAYLAAQATDLGDERAAEECLVGGKFARPDVRNLEAAIDGARALRQRGDISFDGG